MDRKRSSSSSGPSGSRARLKVDGSGAFRPRRAAGTGDAAAAVAAQTGSSVGADLSSPSPFRDPDSRPVVVATMGLVALFKTVNPSGFRYRATNNPRRCLTELHDPVANGGTDNAKGDYILYVNETISSERRQKYRVVDLLGHGTFGQVVKCRILGGPSGGKDCAIKVVKNKPAYFNQGLMEIRILQLLNQRTTDDDYHSRIVRLHDHFVFKRHLCLVFEVLSINLYELIKQNGFRGLSGNLVRMFTSQILTALSACAAANIIHCDVKPENVLLEDLSSPNVRLIDFGSACFKHQTVYSYIQSRFYRAPEVLLGVGYTSAIDVWSLGCLAAELFLGLPLFPGSSEYNQLSRIRETCGPFPVHMLRKGKNVHKFFNEVAVPAVVGSPRTSPDDGAASGTRGGSGKHFEMKSAGQYARERKVALKPNKKYFKTTQLESLILDYPMKRSLSSSEQARERKQRTAFVHFLDGVLQLDPKRRWTAAQACQHPFATGHDLDPLSGWSPVAADPVPSAVTSNDSGKVEAVAGTPQDESLHSRPATTTSTAAAAKPKPSPPSSPATADSVADTSAAATTASSDADAPVAGKAMAAPSSSAKDVLGSPSVAQSWPYQAKKVGKSGVSASLAAAKAKAEADAASASATVAAAAAAATSAKTTDSVESTGGKSGGARLRAATATQSSSSSAAALVTDPLKGAATASAGVPIGAATGGAAYTRFKQYYPDVSGTSPMITASGALAIPRRQKSDQTVLGSGGAAAGVSMDPNASFPPPRPNSMGLTPMQAGGKFFPPTSSAKSVSLALTMPGTGAADDVAASAPASQSHGFAVTSGAGASAYASAKGFTLSQLPPDSSMVAPSLVSSSSSSSGRKTSPRRRRRRGSSAVSPVKSPDHPADSSGRASGVGGVLFRSPERGRRESGTGSAASGQAYPMLFELDDESQPSASIPVPTPPTSRRSGRRKSNKEKGSSLEDVNQGLRNFKF